MTSGKARIADLATVEFRGKKVGAQITEYAKKSQRLNRDLAAEFEAAAKDARKAMYGLKGHPALFGIDVKVRARWVSRRLERAKELAVALSAESVKFAAEYQRQFIEQAKANNRKDKRRKVDL